MKSDNKRIWEYLKGKVVISKTFYYLIQLSWFVMGFWYGVGKSYTSAFAVWVIIISMWIFMEAKK